MYILIFLILIAIAAALLLWGGKKKDGLVMSVGIVFGLLTFAFFWFMSFWGEALWFDAVEYPSRFWKVIWVKAGVSIGGALLGDLVIFALTWTIPRSKWIVRGLAILFGTYISFNWALVNWDKILLYINQVPSEIEDPILGMSVSFYMFSLPVYLTFYALLISLGMIALIASLISVFITVSGEQIHFLRADEVRRDSYKSIYISAGFLLIVLGVGRYLSRFELMYSPLGTVTGPGWTDVNVRMPLYWVVAALAVLGGLFLVVPRLSEKLKNKIFKNLQGHPLAIFAPLISVVAVVGILWFILLGVVPGMFQWLVVQPNEITMERPYIKNNILFTRQGYGLDRIEERRFPVSDKLTEDMIKENEYLFANIRLWDWRALDAVYKQFQEIRLYYEFMDVDVDRYMINDQYRQVMVSARELQLSNLPAQSQTFVNKRFKYTHGFGITLAAVSEFTPEGLPNLLVKNIPPVSEFEELEVDVPQIYYGELTDTHVIVNSQEKELDYPQGEGNVYIHYPGSGGVEISNLWRKFLFGWKFDGTRLFVSNYPRRESRIMFHRKITDRVEKIAPFLKFDNDPYIVLSEGKLFWMIDAYTVSSKYPYSESGVFKPSMVPYGENPLFYNGTREDLQNINYIRNSVKVVVDAFNGSVDFYVFEEDDPLIGTWANAFPDMFKSRAEMPADLLKHIRYPSDFLLVQGLVFSKYHMTDPVVFYNQEDLWVRATEKYYNNTQPVQPYYIIWEMPETNDEEFILMLPFTPKNKQVLIGWIAGMCDPDNYGRLLAYKFPKEKRVLGTQQVETKIDQDAILSGRLSLWDQRGSRVIRGNVLVIPVDKTLIYVEPIYLQSETAAYPELRLVAVMHDDKLSYADNFAEALYGLIADVKPGLEKDADIAEVVKGVDALIRQANDAFESYLQMIGEKDFEGASQQLRTLSDALNDLEIQIADVNE